MPHSYANFQDHLKLGKLPSVVALYGKEASFMREAIKGTRKLILTAAPDFNHEKLQGKEFGATQIIDKANQLPMMAEKRLIEVTDAGAVFQKGPIENLFAYCEKPNESTCLLLLFSALDARSKIYKKLEKLGVLYHLAPPKSYEMIKYGRIYARREKIQINDDVLSVLLSVVGGQLMALNQALIKLALYVGEEREVTFKDIGEVVSPVPVDDSFALATSLAAGNGKSVFRNVQKLRIKRESPLKILGLIVWQYRKIYQGSVYLAQGMPSQNIGEKLSLFRDRLSSTLGAAQKSPPSVHLERLYELSLLDQKLKSVGADPWCLLERTLLRILPR